MKTVKTAVALQYPEWADAPFISVNVKGLLAETVIKLAKENNVPLKQDTFLSGLLSMQEIGSYVPPETYEVLAKIFAFIKQNEYERI